MPPKFWKTPNTPRFAQRTRQISPPPRLLVEGPKARSAAPRRGPVAGLKSPIAWTSPKPVVLPVALITNERASAGAASARAPVSARVAASARRAGRARTATESDLDMRATYPIPVLVDTAAVTARNVLGGEPRNVRDGPRHGLLPRRLLPHGAEDLGSHTICAVVTQEFLDHQRSIGNDLTTPLPQFGFPGLVPGDRWCVTAANWLRAYEEGAGAFVVLAATNERALEIVPLEALRQLAVDVPADPSALAGD